MVGRSLDQSFCLSDSQSVSQSVNQSISQSINQSINQSANHTISILSIYHEEQLPNIARLDNRVVLDNKVVPIRIVRRPHSGQIKPSDRPGIFVVAAVLEVVVVHVGVVRVFDPDPASVDEIIRINHVVVTVADR